ncbi:MAG: cell division protein FtsQ/DivIB, partial [Pseudomonadota bacterium]
LVGVRDSLEALPWVDNVRIRRRWPSRLQITVNEQVPAARWGERGLLNTRGELFVTDARHLPAELPVMSGPEGSQWRVTQLYLTLREPLLKAGLQLRSVTLDKRGSWLLKMSHGIEVRLGREDVDQRIERFIDVITPMIAGRTEVVDYVDLRYTNGFAIGWHDVTAKAIGEPVAQVLEDNNVERP